MGVAKRACMEETAAACTDQPRANGSKALVQVLAPVGRDAELACATLSRAGLACRSGHDLGDFDERQVDTLSALVLTEEMLSAQRIDTLAGMLEDQPSWSSLPVVVLVDSEHGRSGEAHGLLSRALGLGAGVVVLQRPIGAESFRSVMQSVVRERQRQFQLRDQLDAREKAEAHSQMLAEEMKHRVKNSLTLAASIASQTFRNARTLDEAVAAFSGRLSSMALAQDLLTENGHDSADFRELIEQALQPYRPDESWLPFEIDGPEVRIAARMATAFSMALHELATNAVKYGALSTPQGRVALRWRVEDKPNGARLLHIEWIERGGPPVKPPERRGFGSRLVERALTYDLGGTARIDFEPGGVVCTICATLTRAQEGEG